MEEQNQIIEQLQYINDSINNLDNSMTDINNSIMDIGEGGWLFLILIVLIIINSNIKKLTQAIKESKK